VILILSNLDTVFGLFNREASLTGRTPLWNYLLRDVFLRSPWLGYGFGALWSSASFRIATQKVLGWPFPVAIGDNGFLDILLHTGLVGFIPFLGVLIVSFARSGRLAFDQRSILGFFPLLFMIFVIVANISFSFFLETETFLWLVMIAVLFTVTRPQSARPTPAM
jgi:O-antigen ligase